MKFRCPRRLPSLFWVDTGSRGWTLVELLVATGLMVLVASVVAAIFHAVIGGMAQSTQQAAGFQRVAATVERILSELESGPCDETAERVDGIGLRIEPQSGEDGMGTAEFWFMTRAEPRDDDTEPSLVQINYHVQSVASGGDGRQLVRQQWMVKDTLPQPPLPEEVVSEIVLPSLTEFRVAVWTTNGWTGSWTPSNATNGLASPEFVRVIVRMDTPRQQTLAVTGTAWRVAAGSLPAD